MQSKYFHPNFYYMLIRLYDVFLDLNYVKKSIQKLCTTKQKKKTLKRIHDEAKQRKT